MERWLWAAAWVAAVAGVPLPHEVESEQTRKLLGSSVVTSVSVIMDHGNGTKTYLTDGSSERKPQVVGTPGTLLSPDRYEFYSFGDDGELVKKLMTLDQIQSLIAGGDDIEPLPAYDPQPLADQEGVHKVLESVQNVLKGELEAAKEHPKVPMPLPGDSWSILLPGLLNSDLEFKEAHIPLKTNNNPTKPSPQSQITSRPLTSTTSMTRKPTTTATKYTSSKPMQQSTMTQQHSTVRSTTQPPQTTFAKKPTTQTKHTTSLPSIKTTVQATTKPQNHKPLSTTKKPNFTTKKPYSSESPYVKIPLSNSPKPDTTTTVKPNTSTKKPTTVQRIPSTKVPEITQPIPEKKKPDGVPSIAQWLLNSLSPLESSQNLSVSSFSEAVLSNQKETLNYIEPKKTTTTKRPGSHQTMQIPVHKVTERPTQNKVPSTINKTQTNNKIQNDKVVPKNPKPTISTTPTTKNQTKIKPNRNTTSTTPTKETITPMPLNDKVFPEKHSTSITTERITIANKQPLPPIPEKVVLEKLPTTKPQSNKTAVNSDITSTKKPFTTTAMSLPSSEEKLVSNSIASTTTLPDRITTFSYTSKVTPNGEIVTSVLPSSSTTKQKPSSHGALPTTVNFQITEKPFEKSTVSEQLSAQPMESVRDHVLVSSSMQPTTYHPQNFSLSSKTPILQISHSTTPIATTMVRVSTISEPLKHSLVTTVSSTDSTEVFITDAMKTAPSVSSSTVPLATPLQEVTKPTTFDTEIEEATIGTTTATSNASSGTTISDSTQYPTDEIPFQEIPLKIYESLKDNLNIGQEIITTIISDHVPTTSMKIENTYSTNSEEITFPSTITSTDKTTFVDTIISTTFEPPSQNKVIINNSEPQIIEKNSVSPINKTESDSNITMSKPIQTNSNKRPVEQNNTTLNSHEHYVTSIPTTSPRNVSDEENIETTSTFDSSTFYKDQILQEGISAVTNILLDEDKKQQALKEAILAAGSDSMDVQRIKTTTENEEAILLSEATETPIEKFTTAIDDMKSEVRINEDAELPVEKLATVSIETTTQGENKQSEVVALKEKVKGNSSTGNYKQELKKVEQKISPVQPTKESKLNPESERLAVKKTPEKTKPENMPVLRTSPSPEFSTSTERFKHAEFEKPIPKPLSPFAKKPSSAYQSLDNLPPVAIDLNPAPYESMGLEASTAFLGEDVRRFADLCNELAFKIWTSITGKGPIASRSLVMSPFAVTSLLAMVFLGARGPTSGQMNDVLRLDDMVTFNPHQVLQNVTDSVINSKNRGVATAAFIRELYSDKTKGKILDFYKERVQQYYQGHVEEVTFSTIGDIIRRRTNLLVKRQTLGKVPEYLRGSSLNMRPPLAAFSANIFQTDCEHGSTEGRDGEMYFVVRPSTRQRRLVPVPAVVWRSGFLAGYETSLDATSVCLGPESVVSTILILPGQQGQVAPGDGLARLEQRLIETSYRRGGWSQILRSLMPRPGLELQIPRFSHRSVLNVTGALQRMGLRDLFNARRADLRGLNGHSNDLHLSDMLQVNTFSTCGEETIGARHHVETYPASPQRMGRDESENYFQQNFDNTKFDFGSVRRRQARISDNPRLRFDRPFLYMVRHNPSGMILHMGRFNPRLLP